MDDSWYDTRYTFANENGEKVSMTIADVFTPGVITTRYDVTDNCDVNMQLAENTLLTSQKKGPVLKAHKPLGNRKPVLLRGRTITVPLVAAQSGSKLLSTTPLPEQPTAEPGQTFLLLDDVQFVGTPAVTYKVYLSSKSNSKQSVYIATFNLFGIGAHDDHHKNNDVTNLLYNVTDEVRSLNIQDATNLTVQFIPSNMMMTPYKETDTDTGITVGAIRLESVPIPK